MATTSTGLSPLPSGERIHSLDVLRGCVLLGILLMNITGFGLWGAYEDPTVAGGAEGLNLVAWSSMALFFEGTMRGLFSMLFGVGMFVLTDRLEKRGAGIETANIYFRRILWLIFFGLFHYYLLLWYGEILYVYGIMGLIIFSFRNMAPKKLVLAALFLIFCGTIWNYADYRAAVKLTNNVAAVAQHKAEGKPLTAELIAAEKEWQERAEKRSPAAIEDANRSMRKGYFELVKFLAPVNMKFDTTFAYRHDLWDVLSMMMIGIALFKWKVLTAQLSYRFYLLMLLIGYGVGVSINYYELRVVLDGQFSLEAMSKAGVTYQFGRLFTAMGHVAAIMLFCKIAWARWLKGTLAAVGRMALTNYLMHSVICMIVFTGVGFGLFGKLERYELYYVVFAIWIFQLIVSPIWLSYFRFGPAEWLWRTLTYQKRQPFVKRTTTVDVSQLEEASEEKQLIQH
jgi:uncharacterized protein